MKPPLKPILLVSYFFPPLGMAGVGRPWALFRHLPLYGYQPFVLTVKPIVYPAHDDSYLSTGDEDYITRTGSLDPSRLLYVAGRRAPHAPNWDGVISAGPLIDFKALWLPFAKRAALRLIDQHQIKIVITTSPPPSIHGLGLWLKKRRDICWIADFRDLWVSRPIETAYAHERQRRRAQKLLGEYRAGADHIVAVNASVAKYVGAQSVIMNGSDERIAEIWRDTPPTHDYLHIGYLGSTDSPDTIAALAYALGQVYAQDRYLPLKVSFVGRTNESIVRSAFAKFGLESVLDIPGYYPRPQAVALLADCDILLASISPQVGAHITGTKIFDYLLSRKSILALAPLDSELGKLVAAEGGTVIRVNEREALVAYFQSARQSKARREEFLRVRPAVVGSPMPISVEENTTRWGYQRLAREYAALMDTIFKTNGLSRS